MTKKDYILIAKALKEVQPMNNTKADYRGWEKCAINICNALANENERFDKDRFLKACGVINE